MVQGDSLGKEAEPTMDAVMFPAYRVEVHAEACGKCSSILCHVLARSRERLCSILELSPRAFKRSTITILW